MVVFIDLTMPLWAKSGWLCKTGFKWGRICLSHWWN